MVKRNDIALIIVNNGARELTRDHWVGTVDEMSRDGVPTLSAVLGTIAAINESFARADRQYRQSW